jgi:hypothetical protein
MEYQLKKCPRCNRELQVPADLKTCICMYCGETFDLLEETVSKIPEASLQSIRENYLASLDKIPSLIENYEIMLINFSKKKYTKSFEEYLQIGSYVLQPAERYSVLSDENTEEVSKAIAEKLITEIDDAITKTKSGPFVSTKGKTIDQFRFFLAVYTVPMILKLNYNLSETLTDAIIKIWCQRYPKFTFRKGNYDKLNEGFQRKGLCYITTAVCDSMDKPDDCYELTAFRSFRDHYMNQTEERRAMVEEYYHTAPVIVAAISLRPDSKEKYEEIWK